LKLPVTKDDSLNAYNRISQIRKDIISKKISFEEAAKNIPTINGLKIKVDSLEELYLKWFQKM